MLNSLLADVDNRLMIKELLEAYLQSLQLASYSTHTIAAYRRDVAQWIDYAQIHQIDAITPNKHEVSLFLMDLARKGKESSSISRKISACKNFFKFLQERGHITENVFMQVRTPKGKGRLPQYLSQQQFSEILKVCTTDTFEGIRDRAILEVLYSTGCRASELSSLNYQEVAGQQQLVIRGKGSKTRVVFLVKVARDALDLYYDRRRSVVASDESALFISSKGLRLSRHALYYLIRQYESKLAEKTHLSVHLFRHTFATHLLDEGANLREVQELLGHEQLSSTQIYTHVSVERLKSAYRSAHPHAKRGAD
jgi:integrase/recombinase XerC